MTTEGRSRSVKVWDPLNLMFVGHISRTENGLPQSYAQTGLSSRMFADLVTNIPVEDTSVDTHETFEEAR